MGPDTLTDWRGVITSESVKSSLADFHADEDGQIVVREAEALRRA